MFNFVMRSKLAAWRLLVIFFFVFALLVPTASATSNFVSRGALENSSTLKEEAKKVAAEISEDASFADHKLLFIGFTGVAWDYLSPSTAPNLWRFAQENAAGSLVVKTFGTTTMPTQGWLSLGAGARMLADVSAGEWTESISLDIDALAEVNVENSYQPQFGYLGEILRDNLLPGSETVQINMVGPGAMLALTNLGESSGVNSWSDFDTFDLAKLPEYLTQANLTVFDMGGVFPQIKVAGGTALSAAFNPAPAPSADLLRELKKLDTEFGRLISLVPANYPIIVASVADSDAEITRLQYLAARGVGLQYGSGVVANSGGESGNLGSKENSGSVNTSEFSNLLLGAGSTRQPGIVQITDLLPTIVRELYGTHTVADANTQSSGDQASLIPSTEKSVGTPIKVFSNSGLTDLTANYQNNIEVVTDLNLRAQQVRGGVGYFYLLFGISALAAVIGSVFLILKKREVTRRFKVFFGFVALLPASSFLINLFSWWQVPAASYLQVLFIVLLDIILLLIVMRFSVPGIAIAVITAGALIYDVFTGSQLHNSSVLGYQPQVGARFYGLGNASFVLLATSMLFLCAQLLSVLAQRKVRVSLRVAAVVGIFAATALVDGSPALGADFGGPPALFIGFVALLMLHLGRKIKLSSLLALFAFALLAMLGIAYVDWLKPESQRSHLGEFFQSVISGDIVSVVLRKIGYMIVDIPIFVWIFALCFTLGLGYLLRRNKENIGTILRHGYWDQSGGGWPGEVLAGFLALLAVVAFGFLINDSGLVLPFIGLSYGVPLWMSGTRLKRD